MVTLEWFVRSCIVRSFRVSCIFRIVRVKRSFVSFAFFVRLHLMHNVNLYNPGSVLNVFFSYTFIFDSLSWTPKIQIPYIRKNQNAYLRIRTSLGPDTKTPIPYHSFICMFCRSLFVLMYFFFWSLCCLFFVDIRILITPLLSSNSS